MITRDLVRHAKPDPDLFLAAAAELGVEPRYAMIIGDSVWDLLAAGGPGPCGRADVQRVQPAGTGAGQGLPGLRRPGRDARPIDQLGRTVPHGGRRGRTAPSPEGNGGGRPP